MKTIGQILYESYWENAALPIPKWNEQPDDIKRVWERIAQRYEDQVGERQLESI